MNITGLHETPGAMRMHISVFGRTNNGKSSLMNAITGQQVSLVSEVRGTTTDPVTKSMELYPIGPCMFVDTAGFCDDTELGKLRTEKTKEVIQKTDIAILVLSTDQSEYDMEKEWLSLFAQNSIPVVGVLNKVDLSQDSMADVTKIKQILGIECIPVSVTQKQGIEKVKNKLIEVAPKEFELETIAGHLVAEGDSVLLVMPQDIQAPKGRLILPQVQVIRDLLDHRAVVTSVTTDKMVVALRNMHVPPKLIITDSQVFAYVHERTPKESKLTSFSALMARYKGDIEVYMEGAQATEKLNENSKVLIAEACTHDPLDADIGRVKIPDILRKKFGQNISIDIVCGRDFPDDLTPYSLVIHCGGCMFNRRYMLSRIRSAKEQGIPITNYGIFLAKMSAILDKIIV